MAPPGWLSPTVITPPAVPDAQTGPPGPDSIGPKMSERAPRRMPAISDRTQSSTAQTEKCVTRARTVPAAASYVLATGTHRRVAGSRLARNGLVPGETDPGRTRKGSRTPAAGDEIGSATGRTP